MKMDAGDAERFERGEQLSPFIGPLQRENAFNAVAAVGGGALPGDAHF